VDFVQDNWYWVALAVVSGVWLIYETARSLGNKTLVSPLDATLMVNREDARVIDIREAADYAQGHIPNAKHIPYKELQNRKDDVEKIKASSPLILYCATGGRAINAVLKLQKAGFDKTFSLQGGITEWEKAGLPVTTERKAKSKQKGKSK